MRIYEGLKSVRELGWMLKTERCISRFIYPDIYSPVSAVQLNVLPPLAKCPGVKGSRSGGGTIKRIGSHTRRQNIQAALSELPHSGRLVLKEGERSQRAKAAGCHNDIFYENRK